MSSTESRQVDIRTMVDELKRLHEALAGEKARVDIAERRSIAAGAQVEELQAQIIDLNIYHRKATKELVERLQRSYEDGVIIGRHNDDLTAALRKADARIASADAILIKVAAQGESYLSLGTLLAIRAYVQHINDWADDAASK